MNALRAPLTAPAARSEKCCYFCLTARSNVQQHPQFIEPVDQSEANVHGDAAMRRLLRPSGPRPLSGTLLRYIQRWPRLTERDEDEKDEQGEQDEMIDASDVLDEEYKVPRKRFLSQ